MCSFADCKILVAFFLLLCYTVKASDFDLLLFQKEIIMTEYDDPIVGAIQSAVSVPVDVECEGYPDVIFNIVFNKHPDDAMIAKSVSTLESYMLSYNKLHFFRPIHYVSNIDSLPKPTTVFSVCIHMDCGNANPKALIGAVKAIADTQLPIYRIILE